MSIQYRTSVPATTANLGPGYDILGLALDLRLTALAVPADEWIVEPQGEGSHLLDTCGYNLIAQAFEEACKRHGWDVYPLRIESDNQIPIARGLGSSAAAIVTGMALAQLVKLGRLDRDALFRDAADMEGHPDNVAAAVYGGLQEVSKQGPGCQVRTKDLSDSVKVMLVIPDQMKSTKELREIVPERLSAEDQAANEGALKHVLQGLAEGDAVHLRFSESDRRHQPYRLAVQPTSAAIFRLLQEHPAIAGVFLSGAGTTVGGWIAGEADPRTEIREALREQSITAAVMLTEPDREGTQGEVIRG
ncbi:MAG: homoserine kinase [Fidelibacterota bacterium]|nr:MAG: homoserine kinase [Candidatus Neomarinimicrobiota bacterium]